MSDINLLDSVFQRTGVQSEPDRIRHIVTLREQVYRAIQRCGSVGATCSELADMLRLSYDIVQRRTAELCKRGRIMDSGQRRINPTSGKCAIVWVLASHFHSPINEALYGKEETTTI